MPGELIRRGNTRVVQDHIINIYNKYAEYMKYIFRLSKNLNKFANYYKYKGDLQQYYKTIFERFVYGQELKADR